MPGAELDDLVAYLSRTSRLSAAEVERLVGEVIAFLDERPEEFVRRRHQALQEQGVANEESYRRIAQELGQRRFRAPPLSERQIRRIIYG
jgi:hypothetical protein